MAEQTPRAFLLEVQGTTHVEVAETQTTKAVWWVVAKSPRANIPVELVNGTGNRGRDPSHIDRLVDNK